jgi:hypothetical protein
LHEGSLMSEKIWPRHSSSCLIPPALRPGFQKAGHSKVAAEDEMVWKTVSGRFSLTVRVSGAVPWQRKTASAMICNEPAGVALVPVLR